MALLPRGLCVVLILWSAASRPSTANLPGPPGSVPWWGAQDYPKIKHLREVGDYAALEKVYSEAIERAHSQQIVPAEISYRIALANTYVMLFRYRDALDSYGKARALAEANELWEMAGAVAPGISSVYHDVGDENAAHEAIARGLAAAAHLEKPPYYESALRLLHAHLADNPEDIRKAIAMARAEGNVANQAAGWDLLSELQMDQGDLTAAQESLAASLRLRSVRPPREVRLTLLRLAALRLAQAQATEGPARAQLLDMAERYNQRAMELARELARPTLRHQQGLIELARGNRAAALENFRDAVETIGKWRAAAPTAASSLAGADRATNEEILSSFIETAASEAIRSGDAALTRDSFLAAEQYRAASLLHSRDLAPVWRDKLPVRYWAALGELRIAEAAQIESGVPNKKVDRLRLEITEMEAYAGIGVSLNQYENFLGQTSLIHFQQGLGREELLLSFHLGRSASYVWAVTRDSLQVYELPGSEVIGAHVVAFRNAVLNRQTGQVRGVGEELYRTLFGQLSRTEFAKEAWLLSLEGVLFDLPFAALSAEGAGRDGRPEYLVERHTLQVLPGALLLGQRSGAPGDQYLAVGDPIYNAADPRHTGSRSADGISLNRLAASGSEVLRSAEAWAGPHEILVGADASRSRISSALAARPAIVHFSTHVVQSSTHREQAFLALSLNPSGIPDLLAATDLALLDVSGSLVVMTGCASATGDAVPGAGLLGLTRGWLVAGASAVVGTAWPIPDASGDVVPGFFRNLRMAHPAAALRHSQIAAIRSATWQSDPAYWAAFQVTGGAR